MLEDDSGDSSGSPAGGHRTPTPRAGIRHPQDSIWVRLLVWVVNLGGLAHSTISYGAQWVQQDHADLNTLRASRTHQENTPSYSRRQEMGLAAVEQYSIKQTSVLFQSHVHQGWRHLLSVPPAAGTPQDNQDSSSSSAILFLSLRFAHSHV